MLEALRAQWGLGVDATFSLVPAIDSLGWEQLVERLRECASGDTWKLQAAWTKQVDAQDMQRLYSGATTDYERARYLSLRNTVGGRWLTDDRDAPQMESRVWCIGARLRLGMPTLSCLSSADVHHCQLAYKDGVRGQCQHVLDEMGLHALCCEKSSHRIARHDAIKRLLHDWLEQAGFLAIEEVHVPRWRRAKKGKIEQAVVDVRGQLHCRLPDLLCDCTVRHPCASHYFSQGYDSAGHRSLLSGR